jgi:hypothetical protein
MFHAVSLYLHLNPCKPFSQWTLLSVAPQLTGMGRVAMGVKGRVVDWVG